MVSGVGSSSGRLEEAFRDALDERGLLKDGWRARIAPPPREGALTVFAQRRDARLDMATMKGHAARFFAARIGLTVDKRYDDEAPSVDAARVVLACEDGSAAGTRLAYGCPAEPDDWTAADAAEAGAPEPRTSGLAQLARRCETVWRIALEGPDDRVALTIATIFASVLLGPILATDPTGPGELFGVRTARLKLEGRRAPYR